MKDSNPLARRENQDIKLRIAENQLVNLDRTVQDERGTLFIKIDPS